MIAARRGRPAPACLLRVVSRPPRPAPSPPERRESKNFGHAAPVAQQFDSGGPARPAPPNPA
ncbi:hypothetical protein ACVLV4_002994, partial [Rathayibacter agropyri]